MKAIKHIIIERTKHIIIFFFIVLVGVGLAYLFDRPNTTKDTSILWGPAMVLLGACGIFYEIYMLIYDVRHRGDTSTANFVDKTTTIVQVSEEPKLIREKKSD